MADAGKSAANAAGKGMVDAGEGAVDAVKDDGVLDSVKTALDVAGFIPGPIGTVANLASAGISLAQGNYGEAALSAAAAIPVAGEVAEAAKAAKMIDKGVKAGDTIAKGAETAAKVGKEAVGAGEKAAAAAGKGTEEAAGAAEKATEKTSKTAAEGAGDSAKAGGAEKTYDASEVKSSGPPIPRNKVLEAFHDSQHTATFSAVSEAIKSGRIRIKFDAALRTAGVTSKDGSITVKSSMSMEDVLSTIAHEGRHALDMQAFLRQVRRRKWTTPWRN